VDLRRPTTFLLFALLCAAITTSANATVQVFVDSAPNRYGSDDYAPWEAAAFAGASQGTFVNMSNGCNPAHIGTTNFEIYDEVVYSFGDLGKRLTWIYWVPETTIADLTGRLEISLENWWDGDYLDFYLDCYGSTWLEPTAWTEYEGGVIGTAGMAWWGAYDTDTPEELQEDINEWIQADETWKFTTRLWDTEHLTYSDRAIESNRTGTPPVPEPSTMILMAGGLLGAAVVIRRRRK